MLADGGYVIAIANHTHALLSGIEQIVYSHQGKIIEKQSHTGPLFSALPISLKHFLGIA